MSACSAKYWMEVCWHQKMAYLVVLPSGWDNSGLRDDTGRLINNDDFFVYVQCRLTCHSRK